jgi:hypothetical protein
VGIVLLALILVGGMAAVAIFMLGQSNQPAAPVIVVQPSMTPGQPNVPPPAPTRTFTALPPTLTETVKVSSLIPTGWRQVLSDPFDSNANGWMTGNNDSEFANNQWSVTGGKYRWVATAHKTFYWDIWLNEPTVSDFYLSVDARQVSGTVDANYGLTFRNNGDGTFYRFGVYRFGVAETGKYYFVRVVDWNETILSDWLPTSAVRAGEVNTLTVIGQGTHFTCYINGQLVAKVDDAMISSGKVGLDFGFDTVGAVVIMEYDNFTLYTP